MGIGRRSRRRSAWWPRYWAGGPRTTSSRLANFEGWLEDDVYFGHAGFRHFIGEWLAPFDRHENGVDEFIDATADRIVTLSWQRAYGAGSHVPVELRLANIFTLRNDKVVRLELWSDREAARLEALRR